MRTGLLSELSIIGYQIFLKGENIQLRYNKPDTPPELARLLIDELRKCKAEAMSFLRKTDNIIVSQINTDPMHHDDVIRQTPYINRHGDLVIPFEADPKYFYWNGGQALESTLNELNVSGALWSKYSSKDIRNKRG